MRSIVPACLLGGSLGVAACLLELDHEVACGDGYVDVEAGEECDPGDAESHRSGCGGAPGVCNPTTCELECCGDRVVNGEEECDGPSLGLASPEDEPAGRDDCQQHTVPGTSVPYASGSVGCTSECRFDWSSCSLCGNGQVDPQFVYPDGTVLPAEICDGDLFRLEDLSSVCGPLCGQPSSEVVGCNVRCNGCRLLTVDEPIGCCTPKGAPDDGVLSCCCLLDPRGCEDPPLTSPGGTPVCPGVKSG
ncbi:MAG: hypothetical protein KDK70_13610 [Myxococcales bacterium]|nr:hypothetical protein [Myxococcales bacterium]